MTAVAWLSAWTPLLLLACVTAESEGALAEISAVIGVFKFARALVGDLLKAWEVLSPKNGPQFPGLKQDDDVLLEAVNSVRRRIDDSEFAFAMKQEASMAVLARDIPQALRHELRLDALFRTVQAIDRQDRLFKALNGTAALKRLAQEAGPELWLELGDMIAPWPGSFPNAIRPTSVLASVADALAKEHTDNRCNIQQSPKQLLYNLYNSLQMTQLKAYALMQFSLLYRKVRENDTNFSEESQAYQNLYENYLARQADSLKEVMVGASNEFWKCDAKDHILDETYTHLKKFLQGYLQNEVDMNNQQGCWENCDYYQFTKQYSCFKDTYCSKQTACQGNLVNCKFVDSDMWVCPSEGGRSQTRRYEWIKYENGRTLGKAEGSCRRGVTKVDSWWRYLFWHCSYCFCVCDEVDSPYTERYFSLKTVSADVTKNKVLTGFRMIKKDKVIHLQGLQSELLPGGTVNVSNTEWIPVKDVKVGRDKDGVDYHTVSWQQRSIDLDDLHAPKEYLLTGLRWRILGKHLNFEIQVCKYNFSTGQLEQGGRKCQWISNDNTDVSESNPRRRLELQSPDIPTRIRVPSRLTSISDMYVELTHTDTVADVAQTAVPFFDLQPAAPDPPSPLVGAGICHKGLPRSGGYIAPKVFTLDPLPHIKMDFLKSDNSK